jgi:hypothetical protein
MRHTKKRGKYTAQPVEPPLQWDEPAIVGLHSIEPTACKHDAELLMDELTTFSSDIDRYEVIESGAGLAIVVQPIYRNLSWNSRSELRAEIEDDIKQAVHHQLRVRV